MLGKFGDEHQAFSPCASEMPLSAGINGCDDRGLKGESGYWVREKMCEGKGALLHHADFLDEGESALTGVEQLILSFPFLQVMDGKGSWFMIYSLHLFAMGVEIPIR